MKKIHLIILPLIFAIGSFLRFYNLDFQSLWLDELISMVVAKFDSIQGISHITEVSDVHPPGYYILLHFWINVFGDSEIQIRMLSAIAGSASILAIYFLAAQLYSKKGRNNSCGNIKRILASNLL